jgi:sulfur-oxidizing protein SoxX
MGLALLLSFACSVVAQEARYKVDGVGSVLTPAQLRLSVVDYSKVTAGTAMPSFHKAPAGSDKPTLTAEQIEDVVAYLATLKTK